jgi:hypothetical protein
MHESFWARHSDGNPKKLNPKSINDKANISFIESKYLIAIAPHQMLANAYNAAFPSYLKDISRRLMI